MEFLESLGIDINLLVAQIINFGILLFLLIKFLYKPIIKKIDEEEEKLELAEKKAKLLAKEKEDFLVEKARLLREAKERAKAIIEEAEKISQELKKKNQEKINKEIQHLILETKRKLESQKLSFEKKVFLKIKKNLEKKLLASYKKNLSENLAKDLQAKIFFPLLKEEIKNLEINNQITFKKNIEKDLGGIKKVFSEKKIVFLESAFPLSKTQKKELEKAIALKLNLSKNNLLNYKINKDLLSGFRLEIRGFLLESNLWQIISENIKNIFSDEKKER